MTVRTRLIGGVVLGLATTVAAPAWSAPPAAAAAPPPSPAAVVRLVTGDLVELPSAARAAAAVLPRDRHGMAGSFHTVRSNGDTHVIPAAAEPYLGRGLDRGLFDVTQLARAGGDRVPVRLTYRTGAAHRAIPGITITGGTASAADGYVDRRGAALFGRALVDQAKADAAAGWPDGAGIFAGLTGLRYAGPAAAPPVTPKFPMFTLRVLVTGPDGQPAPFAAVLPVNVDNVDKYEEFAPPVSDGETRISLPAGNYGFMVWTSGVDGDTTVERYVNVGDYRLTKAQTLNVDFRTATTEVTVDTPRPSVGDGADIGWVRADVTGATHSISFASGGGNRVLVDPGRPARVGTLAWSNGFHRGSPAGSAPYTYDLRFASRGSIPADQHYRVTDADVATITARYHTDPGIVPADAFTSRAGFLPGLFPGSTVLTPIQPGSARTEYVAGSPGVSWQNEYVGWQLLDFDTLFFARGNHVIDDFRTYRPGTSVTEDWARAPVTVGLSTDLGQAPSDFSYNCPACRGDDHIRLHLDLVDSTPGHIEFFHEPMDTPFGPAVSTDRIRLFAGDTALADDSASFGALDVPVGPAATTYRVVNDSTHATPWNTLSTATHTEWTFSSARPPADTAPPAWTCGNFAPRTGNCAVLPLLTLRYAAPVDLTDTAPAGPQHLGLTVAAAQAAPAVPITSVTAEVSFDHGGTWSAASVTGGGGSYDAAFTAPGAGTVSTRVTAHDANGAAVTQTITDAYALGGGA
jgi:hypothetical protein